MIWLASLHYIAHKGFCLLVCNIHGDWPLLFVFSKAAYKLTMDMSKQVFHVVKPGNAV